MSIEKVSLRPIENEDLDLINKWKNDEDVFKYLGGGYRPTSKSIQKTWFPNFTKMGESYRFIIMVQNQPIGIVGLYDISYINQNAEVGIYIGEKNFHGKGIGKQAYKLIEEFAYNYLNLMKLKLNVVADNTSAYNMWLGLGFAKKGLLEKERFISGKFCDVYYMEKWIRE